MTITGLLLVAVLMGDPQSPSVTVLRESRGYMAAMRGQSPSYDDGFAPDGALGAPSAPATAPPVQSTFIPPGGGYPADPFLGGAPAIQPYTAPLDPSLAFGIVGPQPYRFGWTTRFDVGYAPSASATSSHTGAGIGKFSFMEANLSMRYTTGIPAQFPSLIFSWTPEFNYRGWGGPQSPNLPENVFRFASDFELATPGNEPLSLQLGFTPSLNTDFDGTIKSEAYNFDGRAVLFWRTSPDVMLALGAFYWDRVDDIILPYAGVVWTPNDRWEFRLLFPKSRISYFLGNDAFGSAVWAYGGVEYNVEAYQVGLQTTSGRPERIQLADYRAMFGIRSDNGAVATFVEAGYIFDRDVHFQGNADRNFSVNDGFFGRLGIRY